jgi:hypothetical protein
MSAIDALNAARTAGVELTLDGKELVLAAASARLEDDGLLPI